MNKSILLLLLICVSLVPSIHAKPIHSQKNLQLESVQYRPNIIKEIIGNITSFQVNFSSNSVIDNYDLPTNETVFDVLPINATHVWFTILDKNSLFLLDTAKKVVWQYSFSNKVYPFKIKNDSDGNIWFTDYVYSFQDENTSLCIFSPTNLTLTIFEIKEKNVAPFDLYVSPTKIWYSQWLGNKIAYLDLFSKNFTEIDISCQETCGPLGIVENNDGSIWFVESYTDNIVKYDPQSKLIVKYPLGEDFVAPVGLAVDSNGNFWTGAHGGDAIVEFFPQNSSAKGYYVPKPREEIKIRLAGINDLHFDTKGNLWAIEHFKDSVAYLDMNSGTIMEYITDGIEPNIQFGKPWLDDFWFAQYNYGRLSHIKNESKFIFKVEVPQYVFEIAKASSLNINFKVTYVSGPLDKLNLEPFGAVVKSERFSYKAGHSNTIKIGETVEFNIKVTVDNNAKVQEYQYLIGVQNQLVRAFHTIKFIVHENFFQAVFLDTIVGYIAFFIYVAYKRKIWHKFMRFDSN